MWGTKLQQNQSKSFILLDMLKRFISMNHKIMSFIIDASHYKINKTVIEMVVKPKAAFKNLKSLTSWN